MLKTPGVHQNISRSTVEPRDLATGRETGKVADTTDINDDAMSSWIAE
jgi:hypothetical protein